MQYGFYFDAEKCIGCKTCQLACKDYKNLSRDINFRRVYEYSGGNWLATGEGWEQTVFSYYLSIACNHCSRPVCVEVCPTGAMYQRPEDGIVTIDEDICIGCQLCHMACPYDAPQYDADKGHMTKCNGCYERLAVGLKPVCVEACPTRALDFGPIEELRARYGSFETIAPLPPESFTDPNIVVKPNPKSQPNADRTGGLGNPGEV